MICAEINELKKIRSALFREFWVSILQNNWRELITFIRQLIYVDKKRKFNIDCATKFEMKKCYIRVRASYEIVLKNWKIVKVGQVSFLPGVVIVPAEVAVGTDLGHDQDSAADAIVGVKEVDEDDH